MPIDHPEIREAKRILREQADKRTQKRAEKLVKDGKAAWILDPHVYRVVGLVKTDTHKAAMVVYLEDDDFETTDLFETL